MAEEDALGGKARFRADTQPSRLPVGPPDAALGTEGCLLEHSTAARSEILRRIVGMYERLPMVAGQLVEAKTHHFLVRPVDELEPTLLVADPHHCRATIGHNS